MPADTCQKCGGTGIVVNGAHRRSGGLSRASGVIVSRCGTCKGSGKLVHPQAVATPSSEQKG
jgi:DnaJ-class molecular chaperone